jgi:hypothetical protein
MGKGTDFSIGALLQGLLATFTGGSLILFAVLAATIGLSTPQSDSPSTAGRGGARSGGAVAVQGLGPNQPQTGSNISAPPTGSAPTITGTVATAPSGPGATPPTLAAGDSDRPPPDTSGAVAATAFGVSVPQVLTPGDTGNVFDPPVGAPIRSPGVFFPTTPDELPASFKALFRAGNGLGARDIDKADRVARHLGGKALRKAGKSFTKAKKALGATKRSGTHSATGGTAVRKTKHTDRSDRSESKHNKAAKPGKAAKETKKTERKTGDAGGKHASQTVRKESKQAAKEVKKESKEAKKEDRGHRSSGADNDDDGSAASKDEDGEDEDDD